MFKGFVAVPRRFYELFEVPKTSAVVAGVCMRSTNEEF